jgi:hypothetical protein
VKLVDSSFSWWSLALLAIVFPCALGVVFWLFGYVGTDALVTANGFDYYSADLLTLFNPMGFSLHIPELPQAPGAYEGFAYLGTGLVILTAAAVVMVSPRDVTRAQWRAVIPVFVACLLLAIFSFASIVRLAGRDLVTLASLYEKIPTVMGAFRSPGRFIWPLHYLVIAFAIGVLAALLRRRLPVLRGIFLFALAIQITDMNRSFPRARFHTSEFHRPRSAAWGLLKGDYDHLAVYPPQLYGGECGVPFDELNVYRLSYVAYRAHLTINSGYVARYSGDRQTICRISERLATDGLDDRTVYIAAADHALPGNDFVCGLLDGYQACVTSKRPTPFVRALLAAK